MISILVLVLAGLALAKPLAHWIADRTGRTGQDAPLPPQSDASPSAEQKSRQLQDQVNSKIHWDAPAHEVLGWLSEKHAIEGDHAQSMLAIARQARVRAIRERSLYGLMASGIGMVATGTPIAMEMFESFVFGLRTYALTTAFVFCTVSFGKYLERFLTGKTDSTINS